VGFSLFLGWEYGIFGILYIFSLPYGMPVGSSQMTGSPKGRTILGHPIAGKEGTLISSLSRIA
jgi:hypothetical protein